MRTMVRMMFLILWIVVFLPALGWTADVTLAWDPSAENTIGYRLYAREHDQAYDYAHPEWQGEPALCTLTGFDEYESYYFVVRAVDSDGNESGDSNEVYWSPSGEAPAGGDGASGGGGCFVDTLFK